MYIYHENYSLLNYNTFGINALVDHFVTFASSDELIDFFHAYPQLLQCQNRLILGGGSNMLFVSDFNGLVIHSAIKGVEVVDESADFADVEVGAGVIWDDFVAWSVENGLSGIENLSLIPGTVGAAPVQNIGAYGVEAESVIQLVKGVDLLTLNECTFTNEECQFGYRDSFFKRNSLNNFVVNRVTFRLSKKPNFLLEYGSLKEEVLKSGAISLQNVRNAVIAIRSAKLPDPKVAGNAGSFFKNPVVASDFAADLKLNYPNIPTYPAPGGKIKLAAGWLIEQCGWKGKSIGNAAVHARQALVLVNQGNASGMEIYNLSQEIVADVFERFGVLLEREVNVIGNLI